jgi:WD40 repeat protein
VARLWDARTGAVVKTLRGHTEALRDAEFSRSGRFVVTASDDADARIWPVRGGRRQVLRGHFGSVAAASFSPDGRWVLTAGPTTAGLWSSRAGRLFYPTGPAGDPFLRGHTKALTSATFAPDGRRILTSSLDGTVRTYLCTLCGRLDSLVELADDRLARLRG